MIRTTCTVSSCRDRVLHDVECACDTLVDCRKFDRGRGTDCLERSRGHFFRRGGCRCRLLCRSFRNCGRSIRRGCFLRRRRRCCCDALFHIFSAGTVAGKYTPRRQETNTCRRGADDRHAGPDLLLPRGLRGASPRRRTVITGTVATRAPFTGMHVSII